MADTKASTSPNEAPEIKNLKGLRERNPDVLGILKSIPNLTETEKTELETEYNKALAELETSHASDKEKTITDIKAEIDKLKANLGGEKADQDSALGDVESKKTDTSKQELVTVEIQGRLAEFKQSITDKLNAPVTPETPGATTPESLINQATLEQLNDVGNLPKKPESFQSKIYKYIANFFSNNEIGMIVASILGVNGDKIAKMQGYIDEKEQFNSQVIMNILESVIGGNGETKGLFESIKKIPANEQGEIVQALMNQPGLTRNNLLSGARVKEYLKHIFQNNHSELDGDSLGKTITDLITKNPYDEEMSFHQDSLNTPAPIPATTEAPATPTEAERQKQQVEEIKTAQEADTNLTQAQTELDEANDIPVESKEKKAKIETAEKKLNESKNTVKTFVDNAKTEVTSILKNTEDELRNVSLTLEQTTIRIAALKKQFEEGGSNDRAVEKELKEAKIELKELEIKKSNLTTAISNIQQELAKFPVNDTKAAITAEIAIQLSQEAERIYGGSQNIAEAQKTKETNETEENEIKETLNKLSEEIKSELYNPVNEDEKYKIDNVETVQELEKKLDEFSQKHTEEKLKKMGINHQKIGLKDALKFSLGKIQLIKDLKSKEKEMASKGRNINFENTANWIEKSWDETLELDIDENILVDETFLPKNHPTITAIGGLDDAVRILLESTEPLATGDAGNFKSKNGKKFQIITENK